MNLRRTMLVVALGSLPSVAAAQRSSSTTWLTFGGGRASFGDLTELGAQLTVSHQTGPHLFGTRVVLAGDILSALVTVPGTVISVRDVGIMYGRARRPGLVHLSAAAGLGIATITRRTSSGGGVNTSHLGIPVEAQLFFRPTRVLGLGLYGYGDFNSDKTFFGFSFSVEIGRLR